MTIVTLHEMPTHGPGHNASTVMEQIQTFNLRRSGKRPLSFKGTELCSAMSFTVGTPFWYEVNIFQKVDETFVVEIKIFTKSDNDRELFHAHEISTFSDVFEYLENYDPVCDVDAGPVDFAMRTKSIAEIGLQAAALRLKIDEARRQFGDLVGQILYALEEPDTAAQ
jgi:hypothetical protein